MIPVIALVGRPNVGKSTLFNRLTRSRDALVADFSGLTRDRQYGQGRVGDRPYMVIDTGGVTGLEEGLDFAMAKQSYQAIEEADAILFMVDAKSGIALGDRHLAQLLRQSTKPVWLVVNKTDGLDPDIVCGEFWELGLGLEPFAIAASHNRGVRSLVDEVLDRVDQDDVQVAGIEQFDSNSIRMAVVGRPNVGKSTLVNRMLGEERVVVYDHPGTTMDSIYIPYERADKSYVLIDTAGVRRRKNIKEAVEKFSIVKTLKAIEDAQVVIIVLDARTGVVDQDLSLLGIIRDAGKALVVAINKWDGMSTEEREQVRKELDRRLDFLDYADFHFISALHGTGVGHLYDSVHDAWDSAFAKWQTRFLTDVLEGAVANHAPPIAKGRRIKLRYAHQGGSNPPIIVIHGSQTDQLPSSYQRYLENLYRKVLKVRGTPIRFEFRNGENPYVTSEPKRAKMNPVDARKLIQEKRREMRKKDKPQR